MAAVEVRSGLEVVLAESFGLIAGRRIGLITNPTAVDRELRHAVDLLLARPGVELAALFGPEHGIRGEAPDGSAVPDGIDQRTGLSVYSLYGATRAPRPEHLAGLDALLFDIQAVGARFYTYLWTMALALEACAERGVEFIVLDRPNPLGGAVEGPLVEPGQASFVGLYPIPVRYGLTVGELASWVGARTGASATVKVVPAAGWRRGMAFAETGLPWITPSPNLPTLASAWVYPGTCFIEGTNVSEGRGTPRPFEWIGAPWVDGRRLAEALTGRALAGVAFREVVFMPTASKYAGEVCRGVELQVTDRREYRPVATGVHLVEALRATHRDDFRFLERDGRYPIDRLYGSDAIRSGAAAAALIEGWAAGEEAFEAETAAGRFYPG